MPKCRNCQSKLPLSKVKPQFNCPSCGKPLTSNLTSTLVICVVGWSLLIPVASTAIAPAMCGTSGWCYGMTDVVVGAVIFFPLFLLLLRVKVSDPPPPGNT